MEFGDIRELQFSSCDLRFYFVRYSFPFILAKRLRFKQLVSATVNEYCTGSLMTGLF